MLNLGGLFFTLAADTRGLESAQRRVERFATDVRNAFRGVSQGNVAPQFAAQLARQERSVVAMYERIKKLQNQVSQAGFKGEGLEAATRTLHQLSRQYDAFTRKMAGGIPLNALDFGRRMQHMRSQIDDATRSINNMQKELIRSTTPWGNSIGLLHSLGSAALVVQGHFGGLSTRMFAFGNLIRENGFAIATTSSFIAGLSTGIGYLATESVAAGRALERLEMGFQAISGNAAVASQHITFVKDVADQAGIVFDDAAKGFQRFLASADGVITLQQTRDVFRGISLAAATMQLSVEDTQGVFRALDQMLSKGTVQAEELRGQLGDRLPGAFKIAAASMGVTTRQLGEMMKKGQVVSSEFVPKFTETLTRMFNIDTTKSIDTLQASLGRLGNSWTYLAQQTDRITGASRIFKSMVDGLVTSLNMLAANLPQILTWMGALAGAFTGLAAAMAIQAIVAYVTNLWNMVAAYNVATRSVSLLTIAVNVLNAAMTRLPAGKLVGILINLAVTIGTAVLGYKAMENALNNNQRAMADISGINAYITAQKQLGFQVRATTQDMIVQVGVAMAQQIAAMGASAQKVQDLSKAVQGLGNENIFSRIGRVINPAAESRDDSYRSLAKQLRDETKSLNQIKDNLKATQQAMRGLRDVNALPEWTPQAGGTGEGVGAGAKKTARDLTDSIDRLDDFILKMQEAESILASLGNAPGARKLIEDLYEARRAINQLNPKQLSALDNALTVAGIGAGTLEERLSTVITRTREAGDAAKAFTDVWEGLDNETRRLQTFNAQIDYLRKGGDESGLKLFQDLEDAYRALKDIDPSTSGGAVALQKIRDRLREVGIAVDDTGNALNDTALGLAKFYNRATGAQDAVRVWTDFAKSVRDANQALAESQSLTIAYNARNADFVGRLFSADTADETSKAIARGRSVDDMRRRLLALGQDQGVVNEAMQQYLDLLRQLDDASVAQDRARQAAEANRDALHGMLKSASTGFKEVITGVKSLGDALRDLATNVLDSLWERFITMPLDNWLSDIGRKQSKKDTAGIDTLVSGLPTPANDNATGVSALGAAANMAANALSGNLLQSTIASAAQLATQALTNSTAAAAVSAKTAAESAQGAQLVTGTAVLTVFRSAVLQAASSLMVLAATAGEGGGEGGGNGLWGALAGVGKAIFNGATKRALGGPMSAGQLYHINEPGITGEYFIPSVNGYMSRQSAANGNGPAVHIDASTVIDARGASVDAVARLEQSMALRDERLRKELPYLIDSRVRASSNRGRFG